MRKFFGIAVIVCVFASTSDAQVFRKRTTTPAPNQIHQPIYQAPVAINPSSSITMTATPNMVVASPTVMPANAVPNYETSEPVVTVSGGAHNPCPCPCPPPGGGECSDYCSTPPKITYKPQNCPPSRVCTQIPVTLTPGDQVECINSPFYGKGVKFKATIEVPAIIEECKEVIRFKDYKIDLICCEIVVCVPCEKCYDKTKKCVMKKREVNLEAFARQDGTIDVYANNVPGMPSNYVTALKLSAAEYAARFPGATLPTYP